MAPGVCGLLRCRSLLMACWPSPSDGCQSMWGGLTTATGCYNLALFAIAPAPQDEYQCEYELCIPDHFLQSSRAARGATRLLVARSPSWRVRWLHLCTARFEAPKGCRYFKTLAAAQHAAGSTWRYLHWRSKGAGNNLAPKYFVDNWTNHLTEAPVRVATVCLLVQTMTVRNHILAEGHRLMAVCGDGASLVWGSCHLRSFLWMAKQGAWHQKSSPSEDLILASNLHFSSI